MSELLEQVLHRNNLNKAYLRVKANKGVGGVDGIEMDELLDYLKENKETIVQSIRDRKYKPQPVRRVEIPKGNGKTRKLGIPTLVDRVIQQAIVQVLTPICGEYFSEYSYGFRPGRSCEMAITQALEYLNDGCEWMVDIDLEKFFDKVSHDRLMSYVHVMINDADTESLITRFLKSGVMEDGKVTKSTEGTPQGGNLSPLLSNIMLNQLDKELEARGLHFVRYADDIAIFVRSEASAKRVMYSVTRWIEKKLGLTVNMEKTKVSRPVKTKLLGFGFYKNKTGQWRARPHGDSVKKFKQKIKQLTKRKWSINLRERISKINALTRGWINYFAICDMKTIMRNMDAHLRTQLRMIIWKQWKVPSKRQWGLQKLGVNKDLARLTSYVGDRYYWVTTKTCVSRAISKEVLKEAGYISLLEYYTERNTLKFN